MLRHLIVLPMVFLMACGAEPDQDLSKTELVQNIDNVPYQIKTMVVDFDITYQNGARDNAQRKFLFRADESTDQIRRLNDGGRFQLLVNEQNVGLDISPDGDLYYRAESEGGAKGCQIQGRAQVSGKASHTALSMVWKLDASRKGDGCTEGLTARFNSFRESEVLRLNLSVLSNFFKTLDQDLNLADSIRITVRLDGRRE